VTTVKPIIWRGLAAQFLMVLILLMAPGDFYLARATGPGTGGSKIQINDERVGPYVLLVATSPLPLTVGQMSVWVRVIDAETNQLRRDSAVRIEASRPDGVSPISALATHQNAGNDYDYVAHFEVQKTGQWVGGGSRGFG